MPISHPAGTKGMIRVHFEKAAYGSCHFAMELFMWNTFVESLHPVALHVIEILQVDHFLFLYAAGEYMFK